MTDGAAAKGAGIRFWKMSGAGNDFIVLPLAPYALPVDPAAFVRRVCRRGVSVGADGVLFVVPPSAHEKAAFLAGSQPTASDREKLADVALVHYNADGGRSGFCGNGTRCAARFAVAMGLATPPLTIRTDAGVLGADVDEDRVRIDAPSPSEPSPRTLSAAGVERSGWFLVAGVPHFVLCVDDPDAIDVGALGASLRSHRDLAPDGANVDFVGPEAAGRRRLRTYERGVEGETLACGSGALAAAAVLARQGAKSPIVFTPASGIALSVEFDAGRDGAMSFRLSGEARIVFEGVLAADPLMERQKP